MSVPLKLNRVTKTYASKTAVNGIDLQVNRGEIYGLLGANGAGKTTTMRMVLGLIYPDEGDISYFGKPYDKELTRKFGYLPEERGLYPKVKVSEQILYLAQLKGMSRKDADRSLKEWLEKFGVPENYNRKIEELSKGNQQKIQFIAAVIHQPEIIIMDEAFSGLDPVNVELLKDTVKQLRDQGTSILFSTHRMEHVEELCKNISILHQSNTVLQGNIREIKSRFPKEKVWIRTVQPVQGLEQIAGVEQVREMENGCEIKITRPEAAQHILTQAMQQTTVEKFEIKEPTLNEIFIKSVGGNADE
ncbi:ABC transporter ATP-binding protein [Marinicrinis sediminis]|uniref:ABC transporter ATP-binding protein n=1 Tax=Marinicrinis sediminis TaxID=1652465 RepID=A0ABW5RHV2_9BACL